MSHRAIDELAALRQRLAEIDADIEALRAQCVVDFGELQDLRTTRATLLAQIEVKEEAIAR